ncbi:MAG: Do family serine endopeptidase [Proteobacteria bacterium]|nr:Do family serine endopeptidase [Pseudomonadota bacterium]
MTRKDLVSSALVGAVAGSLAMAGGHWALAANVPGAVNSAPIAPARSVAPASFADIVQRVAPAVVSIDVVGKARPSPAALGQGGPFGGDEGQGSPFDGLPFLFHRFQGPAQPTPMRASGSGFFISADGYIVTNNHVVEGADKVTVRTADERSLPARVIGRDPDTDLAVIKVEGHDFPFVSFEDRAKPRVGDWVVAVGNPFNLGGTATAGIVSAMSRPQVSGSGYVDYMQIDAPINRGNSGGPTFDLYGRVVGVNSAIFSPSGGSVGIGFDIPADVAARVSRQLIAHGKVVRGYIGATIQNVTPEIAESLGLPAHQGALVADVTPDGPSQRAGLQPGDLVLKVDGHAVTSANDLTRQVALAHAGDIVRLDIRRDGAAREIAVRSGTRPSDLTTLADASDAGAAGAGLGLQVAPRQGGGVKVEGVAPGSAAADRGVRPGDVIERVGARPVNSAADVRAAVADARHAHRKDVLLRLSRRGQHLFLPLAVPDDAAG